MSNPYSKPAAVLDWNNDSGGTVNINDLVVVGASLTAAAQCGIVTAGTAGATTIVADALGVVALEGVFELPQAAVSILANEPVYGVVGVYASIAVTNVPTTAKYFIGWATRDSASGAATCGVKLAPFNEAPHLGTAGHGTHSISSASAITVAVATHLTSYPLLGIIASAAGTQAIAFPALAEIIPQGSIIWVKKTGSAGAVTITAGTGTTIVGGATVADQDAQNDYSAYMFVGTEWLRIASVIA